MAIRLSGIPTRWLLAMAAVVGSAIDVRCSADVLLDYRWDGGGDRGTQDLPARAAWFASSASSLSVSGEKMVGESPNARLWVAYFADAGPVTLQPGQTLKATWVFSPRVVSVTPTSMRGLRVGLFDSSSGQRIRADGFSTGDGDGAPGKGVRGYMLNMNVATTFTVDAPMEWYERTDVTDVNLMGSSAVFTRLESAGPEGVAEQPAFANEIVYTLEMSVTREDEGRVRLTSSWNGGDIDITHSVADVESPTTSFDTFAIRPAGTAQAAAFWDTTRVKVEVLTP